MRADVMVFLEPTYAVHGDDRLLNPSEGMNPDGLLTPMVRLRETLARHGVEVHTADRLRSGDKRARRNLYYSLGPLVHTEELRRIPGVEFKGAFILEPPVVYPRLYRSLPEFARVFERVYLFNDRGDGYRLGASLRRKVHAFQVPQPFDGPIEALWQNRARAGMTLINSNKSPASYRAELYGERLRAIAYFGARGHLDLYGRGWDDPWRPMLEAGRARREFPLLTLAKVLRRGVFPPYLRHRRTVRQAYRGEIAAKHEVLSRYTYAICYENMEMRGYITEKIFDCLYVGTIPIYRGAPDVTDWIPPECFIDARRFPDYPALERHLAGLTEAQLEGYRVAGRRYLLSAQFQAFSSERFAARFVADLNP